MIWQTSAVDLPSGMEGEAPWAKLWELLQHTMSKVLAGMSPLLPIRSYEILNTFN